MADAEGSPYLEKRVSLNLFGVSGSRSETSLGTLLEKLVKKNKKEKSGLGSNPAPKLCREFRTLPCA